MPESPYRAHQRTVSAILRDYPGGLDDPSLPPALALVASRERWLQANRLPPPTRDQLGRVRELFRAARRSRSA